MWMPSDSNGSWVAHAEAHMLRNEVEVLVDCPLLTKILLSVLVQWTIWCEM